MPHRLPSKAPAGPTEPVRHRPPRKPVRGNGTTPVSCSDVSHSRRWATRSYERALDSTRVGRPVYPDRPRGPYYSPPWADGSTAARTVGKAPICALCTIQKLSMRRRVLISASSNRGACPPQVGANVAGMRSQSDGAGTGGAETAVQFVGEQEVGQLGLCIGIRGVVSVLGLKIVEVHDAAPVGDAGYGHDSRTGGGRHPVQHKPSEGEVAKVIGGEARAAGSAALAGPAPRTRRRGW